ncbi:MAG: hypothetical protein PF439_08600 [Helicobacteraceae bacterium]|jgi:hypothetical protein|nr:hypothetical protein [Helicobacteraceae bacterium]
MRKVMQYIILLSAVFLLSACSSPFRQVKPNEVIESKNLSYIVPSTEWRIDKEYYHEKDQYREGTYYLGHLTENMQFHIYTSNYRKGWEDKLFDKNGHYYDSDVEEHEISKIGKETGVTYSKQWIAYVNHMKCGSGVFSRGFGGSYYSGGVKFYSIACGYYDVTEVNDDGKRILNINYRYTHNTKNPQEAKEAEHTVKQAAKKAILTLKIKNIDTQRMEKEGLMHYDKEFESTKW